MVVVFMVLSYNLPGYDNRGHSSKVIVMVVLVRIIIVVGLWSWYGSSYQDEVHMNVHINNKLILYISDGTPPTMPPPSPCISLLCLSTILHGTTGQGKEYYFRY